MLSFKIVYVVLFHHSLEVTFLSLKQYRLPWLALPTSPCCILSCGYYLDSTSYELENYPLSLGSISIGISVLSLSHFHNHCLIMRWGCCSAHVQQYKEILGNYLTFDFNITEFIRTETIEKVMKNKGHFNLKWRERRDSNSRPPA
jgi:hypothetical protein